MLRSIRIPAKKTFNFLTITSAFCTKTAPTRPNRDVNVVKLVGTLISDSHELQSGTKQLTIKSYDFNDRYSNHNVRIKTKGNFTAGQRLFVEGRLSSFNMEFSDEKKLTATNILARKIFVLENEGFGNVDENSVTIVGNIGTDINFREKDCSFKAVTNYAMKNEQGEVIERADFHYVVAFDSDLRQYIENNLSKRDRILISGRIGHMTHTKDDGRKMYSGFIVPQHISKILRREKSQIESNESEEIEKEN